MTLDKNKFKITGFRDYVFIIIGLMSYAVGFTAFILPHKVVTGGLSGVGTLVYFATDGYVSVAVTQYICNLLLLAVAYRIVGKTFVLRTIFGATLISLFIGICENFFMNLSHPIIQETSMSIVLGGIMCGFGIGTVFMHNGSSGGTDIVAAMLAKVSNMSVGRGLIYTDMCIVLSSIFLPFDGTLGERLEYRVPLLVYGFIVTFLISYMTDMLINTNRMATQFIIFSHKWSEIADLVNREAHRGVTVLDGTGWYSKKEVKILMVWCRKIESVTIHRIIKSVDEHAFITQSNVNGVYGEGFDTVNVKVKAKKQKETEAEAVAAV